MYSLFLLCLLRGQCLDGLGRQSDGGKVISAIEILRITWKHRGKLTYRVSYPVEIRPHLPNRRRIRPYTKLPSFFDHRIRCLQRIERINRILSTTILVSRPFLSGEICDFAHIVRPSCCSHCALNKVRYCYEIPYKDDGSSRYILHRFDRGFVGCL